MTEVWEQDKGLGYSLSKWLKEKKTRRDGVNHTQYLNLW